jgi:hypothetical protein
VSPHVIDQRQVPSDYPRDQKFLDRFDCVYEKCKAPLGMQIKTAWGSTSKPHAMRILLECDQCHMRVWDHLDTPRRKLVIPKVETTPTALNGEVECEVCGEKTFVGYFKADMTVCADCNDIYYEADLALMEEDMRDRAIKDVRSQFENKGGKK